MVLQQLCVHRGPPQPENLRGDGRTRKERGAGERKGGREKWNEQGALNQCLCHHLQCYLQTQVRVNMDYWEVRMCACCNEVEEVVVKKLVVQKLIL